uniref:Uncharacterized protein n=1 Tax=Romanomermis culicivorax TaxID=13658 RepID=A0A915JFT1_ROMCU
MPDTAISALEKVTLILPIILEKKFAFPYARKESYSNGQLASYLLFPLQNYLKDLPPITLKWNVPTTRNPKHWSSTTPIDDETDADSAVDVALGKAAKKTELGKIKWPANIRVSAIPRRVFTNGVKVTFTTSEPVTTTENAEEAMDINLEKRFQTSEKLSQDPDLAGFTEDEYYDDVEPKNEDKSKEEKVATLIITTTTRRVVTTKKPTTPTTISSNENDTINEQLDTVSKSAGNFREKIYSEPANRELNVRSSLSKITELTVEIELLVKPPTLTKLPAGLFDSQLTTSVYQKSVINPMSNSPSMQAFIKDALKIEMKKITSSCLAY